MPLVMNQPLLFLHPFLVLALLFLLPQPTHAFHYCLVEEKYCSEFDGRVDDPEKEVGQEKELYERRRKGRKGGRGETGAVN